MYALITRTQLNRKTTLMQYLIVFDVVTRSQLDIQLGEGAGQEKNVYYSIMKK